MLHALAAAVTIALTGPQVGAPAPDFHLTTLDGKSVSLATYKGKTLVLNDWATWCPPCRQETPDLIATAKKLTGSGDVVFLGVDSTEKAPIVRAFVAAKGVPYQQAIDDDRAFAKTYDVTGYPSTYVVGPDGVLRARVLGNIDGVVLSGLVADARAGRNGTIETAAQKKADALLDPANFSFTGDAAAIGAAAKAASDAIDQAENIDGTTDYLKIEAEANVLRDAAVAALAPVATSDADKLMVDQLRGDAAYDREQYAAAAAAYGAALAVAPTDTNVMGSLAQVYSAQHDYSQALPLLAKIAEAEPSASAFLEMGAVQSSAGRYADARVSFAQAIGYGRAAVRANPNDPKALRALAAAYLNEAGAFASSGDPARARTAYEQTIVWASKLPPSDARYAIDNERAQEGIAALSVARSAGAGTSLSLAPWTGADLPGSIASTYKYRLVVAGTPGATVALAAAGLPKNWVASFCSDRQCAPFRTSVALPASGVKVLEFQLVPESKLHTRATVRVNGGGATASVTVRA